jgi:hypothetical protein
MDNNFFEKEIVIFVKNTCRNLKLASPQIQKDIVGAASSEIT